jgi:hypothetical protein
MAAGGSDGEAGPPSRWWRWLPPWLRALPADLAATATLVVLTVLAVLLSGVSETPLRIVLGLPFVLFLPGYAFIAALLPEEGESPGAGDDKDGALVEDEGGYLDRRGGIDGIECVALSFGLSIAVVPLIGLVLNFTPWGIRLMPILLSVSGFTLVMVAVAAARRWELPEEERFAVPYREWYAAGRAELFEPESRADAALNVLLVLSILLATGAWDMPWPCRSRASGSPNSTSSRRTRTAGWWRRITRRSSSSGSRRRWSWESGTRSTSRRGTRW